MPPCLVCGERVPSESLLYGGLLYCPTCGFVFADTTLSAQEHRQLYQRGYFFGCEYADYLQSKDALQKNFRYLIATLSRFSSGGRLFEIGSAFGFFLELAQFRWQVSGIDVAEDACSYAVQHLGLKVQCGDFLDMPAPAGYDVFCLWDTIEHLREPDRYIEKIAACLRPGGHLALTTGDIGSWNARLQGRRWRLIHPPTHLYYFSVPTMTRFLDRYGFDVVYLSHPGFYRSLGAMAQWLLTRLAGNDEPGRQQDKKWPKVDIYLNFHDIMFVIARKREQGR